MNAFSSSKRILSLDYGTVRIGVALSDESLTLATPLCVVDNTRGESNALDKILVLTQRAQRRNGCHRLAVSMRMEPTAR